MEYHKTVTRLENPRARANPLSALLFLYMIPILKRYNKYEITEENLYEALNEHKSNTLGNQLEILWRKEKKKHPNMALHIALFKQFGFEIAFVGFTNFVCILIIIILVPASIGGLVQSFQNRSTDGRFGNEHYYGILFLLVMGGRILIGHPTILMASHICMKMRVACCSMIYRKALKLSSSALSQTTIGQIINLLSNDVSKFDQNFVYCQNIYAIPIITGVAIFQLYELIGPAAFSGMAFLLIFVPLQVLLGRVNSTIKLKTAVRTDERLRLMNEILSGINVIKMYTWELPFAKLVAIARRYEIKATRAHFYIEATRAAMDMFLTRTCIFITIVVFIFLGNAISAHVAFVITATYSTLRVIVTFLFPQAINSLAEVHISVKRIHNFLNFDEINCKPSENIESKQTSKRPNIVLKDVNVKWLTYMPNYALQNISLNLDEGQLVALVGSVGSGKTTLFNVILKELPQTSGTVSVNGTLSLASQEPWLFTATIQQNILFGSKYDEERYHAVLKVCALEEDLSVFPYGDNTIISENGKSLSGGQRARISLARCVYREADIYLLDDPLSAVDAEVGKYLYTECITNFLSGKICLLITHQLQYLQSATQIIVLQKGSIVGQGTYNDLKDSELSISTLLQEYFYNEETTQNGIEKDTLFKISDQDEPKNMVVHQMNNVKEPISSETVNWETFYTYFKAGGGWFLISTLFILFIVAHCMAASGDYLISIWVNLEHTQPINISISDLYANSQLSRKSIMYAYSGIAGLTILLAFLHSIFFFIFVTRASVNLHNSIFQRITKATMTFFDANPTGRILNRFAKDMGIIDEYIPIVLMDTIQVTLSLVAALAISITIDYLLFLPFVGLSIPFYFIRLLYLKISKNVKRVEGTTRSPIFNHLSATISGLPTVRAFQVQEKLIREFDRQQDLHSSAWYLFLTISKSFSAWFDTLGFLLVTVVVVHLLLASSNYDSGKIGLIITQYVHTTIMLPFGVRQLCELENSMVSAERVFEYTKIETEPTRKFKQDYPKDWPEYGVIIFKDVSMQYIMTGPTILKNCNFSISSNEKIGVVGRTGAGKSSIITALFQMYETKGNILIDNVDVTKIPFNDLRSKISIIPQQPVLFLGSIRKNLDPLEQHNDEELWHALEQVELKQLVEGLVGGLNAIVQERGLNFSIGQKQLLCFARAIIRKNKILIMDEATANVDSTTDAVIQKTIKHAFHDCTVIVIAHRLHTIIDLDKILVMDNGSVAEFDHPYTLLQNNDSLFYKMVQASGSNTGNNFLTLAEMNFNKDKSA